MNNIPVYKYEIGSDDDPLNDKSLRSRSALVGKIKHGKELPAFIDKHYQRMGKTGVKQYDHNKTLKKNDPESYNEYKLPEGHTGRGTSEDHIFWHKE